MHNVCTWNTGWWDWNLGPVACDHGEDELMIFTVSSTLALPAQSPVVVNGSTRSDDATTIAENNRHQGREADSGQVQMHADRASQVRRCWSLWDYPVGGFEGV